MTRADLIEAMYAACVGQPWSLDARACAAAWLVSRFVRASEWGRA